MNKRMVKNNDGVSHELSGDKLKLWDAIRWELARQLAKQMSIPLEEAEQTMSELREKGLCAFVFDENNDEVRWELTELGKLVAERDFGPTPE
jgi:hypothetical protein